tara:strand:- start:62993 stop:64216 length:1224 start_codon:yes stop_codon:yes gene_type:complete
MVDLAIVKPHKISDEITISSEGTTIQLSTINKSRPIVCIIDNNGRIVRYASCWLRYLSKAIGKSVTNKTVVQYGYSLKYLCEWIESAKPYPSLSIDEVLTIVNRKDLLDWHDFQRSKSECANTTLHSREAAVKEFLTWLTTLEGGRLRATDDSPWGKNNDLNYVAKKGNKKSPKIISSDQIICLLLSMYNECERCMFHTQYDTGLRISELVNLRLSNLPPISIYKDQNYEFIPLCIIGTKGRVTGSKERITVISRAALNRIRSYHNTVNYKLSETWKINDPNKPVFLTSNGKAWSERNASKQFKSAVRRSNVGDDFSTHWMRHGTAFSVLNSDIGKDYEDKMLTIMSMLGHANLSTTEIYTQISPVLLSRLNVEGNNQNRLSEAEDIRKATFLPPLKHTEKRGHNND